MLQLLARLDVAHKKVLVLTDGLKPNVFLSGRNLKNVHVMPYSDVSAFHVLWSDTVLIESAALGTALEPIAEKESAKVKVFKKKKPERSRKPEDAEAEPKKAAAKKAAAKKTAARKTAAKASARKTAAPKAAAKKKTAAKKPAAKAAAKKPAAKKKEK